MLRPPIVLGVADENLYARVHLRRGSADQGGSTPFTLEAHAFATLSPFAACGVDERELQTRYVRGRTLSMSWGRVSFSTQDDTRPVSDFRANFLSKARGRQATTTTALRRSRRDLSTDASLGDCTLPGEKIRSEPPTGVRAILHDVR